MLLLLIFLLCSLGFMALAAAMERHQRQLGITPVNASASHLWRCAGIGCLALALALSMWRDGWAVGMVVWTGALTLAGMVTALLLTWRSNAG
ncbi:DUF3325 domain-containing protein [Cellvibrio polysaccharolyticus]|uniref:DUF3325 domain-containing protein n=1 Tax=Cellvibrio polysaccharolyticus TaxID=2082724 RepID=A0A928V8N1_9GAMM|nr:DUF3325 domain-containing protein [Cellvibrio polysaccharolyticus]MBE8718742.1 DUF3325 domain-containing protein [Cellvibrio polysaccharolyticus]